MLMDVLVGDGSKSGKWAPKAKRQFEWAVPWQNLCPREEPTHGSCKVKGGPNKDGYRCSVFKVSDGSTKLALR